MHAYNEGQKTMQLKHEYRETTVIQKSRFIACVKPCFSEEEARLYIEQIRDEFRDASHVCTAYVIGKHNELQRSNDNKEPSGTAGVPMLESILNSGLQNVCACVVRYFGGIKLGAGGLIRAYSGAVTSALANAKKTKTITIPYYKVEYPYTYSGSIEQWLRRNTTIVDIQYGDTVICYFEAEENLDVSATIRDLSKGEINTIFLENHQKEVDI